MRRALSEARRLLRGGHSMALYAHLEQLAQMDKGPAFGPARDALGAMLFSPGRSLSLSEVERLLPDAP